MLLQRFTKHVTNQNWFTVIMEVLIVVVAIFIGLQVDDWNQARLDRNDEKIFLDRLHEDIILANKLNKRIRKRRFELLEKLVSSSDVLHGTKNKKLTESLCKSIVSSNYVNFNVTHLSSIKQLNSTGNLAVISNIELRTALAGLEQTIDTIINLVRIHPYHSVSLASKYPELIKINSYLDSNMNEVRIDGKCELEKMRKNQAFLNHFSLNIDVYDAYIRDGLIPWDLQFSIVHKLIDKQLRIKH